MKIIAIIIIKQSDSGNLFEYADVNSLNFICLFGNYGQILVINTMAEVCSKSTVRTAECR